MDSWSAKQKAMMRFGGNTACKAFFNKEDIGDLPLRQKYSTKAAGHY
eukprot:CAMPEP_0114009736 /NCGR_PEP_ID=MMETSP0372-20130328/6917_1 /TAXON_ID=340204 /ORGANISM="Lankesteria abbotti" /LENGTH=46 /assembly_acc=CAM_ASM_000359